MRTIRLLLSVLGTSLACISLAMYPATTPMAAKLGQDAQPQSNDASTSGLTLTATQDTYIDPDEANLTHGSRTYLRVGALEFGDSIALVRFNLSSIPAGSTINSAQFKAFFQADCGVIAGTIALRRINEEWSSANATWNNRPDINAFNYATRTVGTSTGAYLSWNMTSLVNRWVNQSASYPNYGLAMVSLTSDLCKRFDSLSGTFKPQLVIDYTPPNPTPTPPVVTPTPTPPARISIGGRVWHDANRNGNLDAGESGMTEGMVSLELNNEFIAETTLAADGSYLFSSLLPSLIYRVHVDEASLRPLGYRRTTPSNPRIVVPLPGTDVRTVDFGYAPPPPPSVERVDLWVMGIEVNQGVQDFVFTDLDHAGNVRGFVPLSGSTFANPIIPGKPAVVRVYVGLRDTPDRPITPSGGFSVTGELTVQKGEFGSSIHHFSPVENDNCSEQSGTPGQACHGSIGVYPNLGRQGLNTNSDYDLDLIAQRIHLEGTLNFVIPPEITRDFGSSGVILNAIVRPVSREEVQAADNRFELQLANVAAPNPLNVDLVRVNYGPAVTAPTTAAARRAMSQTLQLTPYDTVVFNRNRVFRYNRERIRIEFAGQEIATLDRCETLWVRLFQAFSGRVLDGRTVLALTPADPDLESDCNGIGWKIPNLGGIAHSRMPDFAATSPLIQTAGDIRRIGRLGQELYHAHLDRRHVSNDHGEADGCLLTGVVADIVAFLTNLDTDCWKPALHPHGSMGEYPPGAVKIGAGTITGRVFGDRGALGIRIEKPENEDWHLTLFDPCPTGPLDQNDPLAAFGSRWNLDTNRYRCSLDDDVIPHDFMSYGPNRWTSEDQFQGITVGAPAVSVHTLSTDTSVQSNEASGLLVTGIITSAGKAGLMPVLPAMGANWVGISDTLTVVAQLASGQSIAVPAVVVYAPSHPSAVLFFMATLPAGIQPRRLALMFQGRELTSMTASSSTPQVRMLWPNGGEVLASPGSHTLRWEASDADGDELTFMVESSHDGGMTWNPLGIVVNETSLDVSAGLGELEESTAALIRVTVSDSMNTTSDQSDHPFFVGMGKVYLPLVEK